MVNLLGLEQGTKYSALCWHILGAPQPGGRRKASPLVCLFNFYAEYIMQNAGLNEAQTGIKVARRYINNLRYADDTTFMAESKEPLDERERGE